MYSCWAAFMRNGQDDCTLMIQFSSIYEFILDFIHFSNDWMHSWLNQYSSLKYENINFHTISCADLTAMLSQLILICALTPIATAETPKRCSRMSDESHIVQRFVYDLSQGLMVVMSQQWLGWWIQAIYSHHRNIAWAACFDSKSYLSLFY